MATHASYKTLFLITYVQYKELQPSLQLEKLQPFSLQSPSTQQSPISPRPAQSKGRTGRRLSRVYIPSTIKPSEFNTNQVSEIMTLIKYCVSHFIIDPQPKCSLPFYNISCLHLTRQHQTSPSEFLLKIYRCFSPLHIMNRSSLLLRDTTSIIRHSISHDFPQSDVVTPVHCKS